MSTSAARMPGHRLELPKIHNAVFEALAAEPDRSWTLEELHLKIHRIATKREIATALQTLRKHDRVAQIHAGSRGNVARFRAVVQS